MKKSLFLLCILSSPVFAGQQVKYVQISTGTLQPGTTAGFNVSSGTTVSFNSTTMTVTSVNTAGIAGFKNLVLNGAFLFDQRNENNSVTLGSNSNTYGPDMFFGYNRGYPGKWTETRKTDTPPAPFGYYWRISVSSASLYQASSETASSEYVLSTRINGLDVHDNGAGTTYAKNLAVSFNVRSSSAGVYGFSIESSNSDAYVASYPVTTPNVWKRVCLNIPGDTAGTWTELNGIGYKMLWDLGSGTDFQASANTWSSAAEKNHYAQSNVIVKVLGVTFDLAGIQMEYGNNCTAFEHHPYDTEKKRLEKYYEKSYAEGIVPGANTGNGPGSNAQEFAGAQLAVAESNFYLRYKTSKYTTTPTVTFYATDGTVGQMTCFSTAGVGTKRTLSQEVLGSEGVGFYETSAVENYCQGHYTVESPLQ